MLTASQKAAAIVDDDDDSGGGGAAGAAEDDSAAHWYWAGDSDPSDPDKSRACAAVPCRAVCVCAWLTGAAEDVWVPYSDAVRDKIEAAFKKGRARVAIDSERIVDLTGWIQRRKDDETRRRAVTRSVGK